MKATVLITGGAGFIGSHIADYYAAQGSDVVIVDNLVSGKKENLQGIWGKPNVSFYEIDIRDKAALETVFEKHRPVLINHHAAQKSVPDSLKDPMLDLQTNLIGLLNLLDLSGKYGVQNFVSASTGGALTKLIKDNEASSESDYPLFESPYAITKFAGERYLNVLSACHGFGYTILRYGNVYGQRQVPDGESGVIPIFVNNILAGKESLLMTYEDMPSGCTRDYIFISDVVRANVIAGKKAYNDVFNIGSGKEAAILDIYNMIAAEFESNVPIKTTGPRPGDVRRSVLDVSKAEKVMDWKPQVSLSEGIRQLKEYYIKAD